MKIPRAYFQYGDVVSLARDLIGKSIFTLQDGHLTGGIISESEAYAGVTDRASHAYGGRVTSRTKVMYEEGGISYIYLCYGIHYLFNIVTAEKGIPHAILIRGIYPTHGIGVIRERRKKVAFDKLGDGPGKVTQCLGLTLKHNGIPLDGDTVWLEETRSFDPRGLIKEGKRVGIDYAGKDASLPWRFFLDIKKASQRIETPG
ncbi:MAG: DNA-3-methyladenine glycosylase [bacterium]|jgi:DNA-3-methyladenine glycosylase